MRWVRKGVVGDGGGSGCSYEVILCCRCTAIEPAMPAAIAASKIPIARPINRWNLGDHGFLCGFGA